MRILLVSHSYPPDSVAGVERYTEGLAAQLKQLGDQVTVLTRRVDPTVTSIRAQHECDQNGIHVIRLVGGTSALDRFLLHDEVLARLFTAAVLDVEPDVVHFNHLVNLSPRSLDLAHKMGAAIVMTLHDFYMACPIVHLQRLDGELCAGPEGGMACARTCFAYEGERARTRWGLRAAYYRRLLAVAERVICPSQYVGSFFRAFSPRPERIGVIPNGISLARIGPTAELPPARPSSSQDRDGLRLAYFGAVAPLKGVHVIVEALRLARLSKASLSILGEAPVPAYADQIRKAASTVPGLTLTFHGRYSPAELPDMLRDVDCVVVPSQVPESFSITAREAMTQGIPVIASNLGALPEAIEDGENGFIFDAHRPAALAAILQLLVEDVRLLPRLRVGARNTDVWSVSDHVNAVREVYQQAIEAFEVGWAGATGETDEQAMFATLLTDLSFGEVPPAG